MLSLARKIAERRFKTYKDRDGLAVLSLDWDAFTGDCSEKSGHDCCGFCETPFRNLFDKTKGREKAKTKNEFWKNPERCIKDIGNPIGLVIAECHADIAWWISPLDYVVNIDAHEDVSDYEEICCATWATNLKYYAYIDSPKDFKGNEIEANDEHPEKFDFIFLCHSSPWTTKESDFSFYKFISYLASLCEAKKPVFFGHKKKQLIKEYNYFLKNNSDLKRSS